MWWVTQVVLIAVCNTSWPSVLHHCQRYASTSVFLFHAKILDPVYSVYTDLLYPSSSSSSLTFIMHCCRLSLCATIKLFLTAITHTLENADAADVIDLQSSELSDQQLSDAVLVFERQWNHNDDQELIRTVEAYEASTPSTSHAGQFYVKN